MQTPRKRSARKKKSRPLANGCDRATFSARLLQRLAGRSSVQTMATAWTSCSWGSDFSLVWRRLFTDSCRRGKSCADTIGLLPNEVASPACFKIFVAHCTSAKMQLDEQLEVIWKKIMHSHHLYRWGATTHTAVQQDVKACHCSPIVQANIGARISAYLCAYH